MGAEAGEEYIGSMKCAGVEDTHTHMCDFPCVGDMHISRVSTPRAAGAALLQIWYL